MDDKADAPVVINHGRRLGCENTVMRVHLDRVEVAPGTIVDDFIVVEPKPRADAERLVTGVAVLPVVHDKIALLRIFRHPMREAGWEVPRGFADTGETPDTAAIRELAEETGLSCALDDLMPLGTLCQEPGVLNARTALYLARNCTVGKRTDFDEPGLGGIQYFTAAEMAEMARTSVLEDACTLTAWFRYADQKQNQI